MSGDVKPAMAAGFCRENTAWFCGQRGFVLNVDRTWLQLNANVFRLGKKLDGLKATLAPYSGAFNASKRSAQIP